MDKEKLKAFVSWSGGKESAISLYKAKNEGINIHYLLNMTAENEKYSRSHRLSCNILKIQAKNIGIPLIQCKSSWKEYEENFKKAVFKLKRKGIEAGVFGDIDLQEHREWVERICKDLRIKPALLLWKENKEKLLKDFIRLGFKAIVVTTRRDFLNQKWLGRQINERFINDLKALDNVDLCGEKGEYHTFVFDGPIFKKRVGFTLGKKTIKNNHCFLEIMG